MCRAALARSQAMHSCQSLCRASGVLVLALSCCRGAGLIVAPKGGSAAATVLPDTDQGTQAVMQALQGTMLLAAVLPHDQDGPKPSREAEERMANASALLYGAYELVQTSGQNLNVAYERLSSGSQAADAAKGIAEGETLLQRAGAKFQRGRALVQAAHAALQQDADPLGPPPQAPRSWSQVDAMVLRVQKRLAPLRQRAQEAKRLARKRGLSLVTVASETATVVPDAYGAAQDDKLLAFLSRY
mmetsp:Transcript_11648/g.31251  ORF Transcript_11648/g.31251 Transcript_11648/m.31251 type:complete len:244 (+) Transcript_11648:66-797(+)